jgi:CDP-paratose 2-epimerase
LADRLAAAGNDVIVFDALARPGVERNLDWLRRRHPRRISSVIADIRDSRAVADVVAESRAVFHFAAQVAVTTSLETPREDFAVNVEGTLNLLEALRRRRAVPLVFASTNKVYGDLAGLALEKRERARKYVPRDRSARARGISETQPLDFHTPYGCSKGAADQYVLDYARSFGVPAVVMRMSCIYGPRQLGTEDQGWVAHFARSALAGRPITIYGDGCQVRDVMHVGDVVEAYLAAWRQIDRVAGRAFNLGGGPENAVSLLEVIRHIETVLGASVSTEFRAWRAGDQRYYVSDISAARAALGLPSPTPWRDGIGILIRWLREQGREQVAPGADPLAAPAAGLLEALS